MHDFMQSLQMRWPVTQVIGLSTTMVASAPIGQPSLFSFWNSEMRSSSGHPASGTPNGLFLKMIGSRAIDAFASAGMTDFSFNPFEHESLPCSWHQMQ